MVETKIGQCNAGRKRHLVHVIDYKTFKDNYYICFTVTYYGAGKVEYGVDYRHKDRPASITKSITLTREELEHIIHEEGGQRGDIDVQRTSNNETPTVVLNRMNKGVVTCSVPMTPFIFSELQSSGKAAIEDFDLVGPYTDTRNGDIVVTDQSVQNILTLVYLRTLYFDGTKSLESKPGRNVHEDLAISLVRDVKLGDVNRFLKPAGLEIQCNEPLQTIFDDEVETAHRVMYKDLPYSAEYFKHATRCGLKLHTHW